MLISSSPIVGTSEGRDRVLHAWFFRPINYLKYHLMQDNFYPNIRYFLISCCIYWKSQKTMWM